MKREKWKVKPLDVEITDALLSEIHDKAREARDDHMPTEVRWYSEKHLRPIIGRKTHVAYMVRMDPDTVLALVREIHRLRQTHPPEGPASEGTP